MTVLSSFNSLTLYAFKQNQPYWLNHVLHAFMVYGQGSVLSMSKAGHQHYQSYNFDEKCLLLLKQILAGK